MGDPRSRKSAAVNRLRNSLHKKRESLADQFEFKMFISIHFYPGKDKKTKSSLFECSEALPVMTNNYEQCIMDGVKNDTYSYESSRELIDKDIVQFHAHSWKPLRRDMIGSKSVMDFFLWPRKDIETVQCHLYSRWKGDHGPFKHVDSQFQIQSCEYEPQLKHLLTVPKRTSLLTVNRAQSTFLFVDKHYFRVDKEEGPKSVLSVRDNLKRLMIYRLRSVCLYLPQDQLMNWGPSTSQDLVTHHFVTVLHRKEGCKDKQASPVDVKTKEVEKKQEKEMKRKDKEEDGNVGDGEKEKKEPVKEDTEEYKENERTEGNEELTVSTG